MGELWRFHRCPIGIFGGEMITRQTRRKCQALVDGLTLPRPFSVDALIRELAERRGRPIRVHTVATGVMFDACGLWISTDTQDDIYVEEETTPFHRDHILLHEIGHILCDQRSQDGDLAALTEFLPDLSPELIRRVLARTNYTTEQEQEAELVASLIRTAAETAGPRPSTGVRGELEIALGIRE